MCNYRARSRLRIEIVRLLHAAGEASIDDIVRATGARRDYVWRTMHYLLSIGVVERVSNGRYRLRCVPMELVEE